MKKLSYILILFLLSCNEIQFSRIAKVHDGDTVTTDRGEKIRLSFIDAPEIGQPYGIEARNFLSKLILNKRVTIVAHGKDRYGRTIGEIYLGRELVNEAEINAGLCWSYKRFAPEKYYREALAAKKKRIGLWASNKPESPFLYRKQSSK